MYLLGYDIGSSSIKASLIEAESGKTIASSLLPEDELTITALRPGWAEQDPENWWKHLKLATRKILTQKRISTKDIKGVGISYQMHGLVLVDKNKNVLRDAIIWCDSRAVDIGSKAFADIGEKKCLERFLNSPGNFTASKLKWVKENEPQIYRKIFKAMLPGDFIAMKLTGDIKTTNEGLSEAILWDFQKEEVANILLDYYDIPSDFLPDLTLVFSRQGELTSQAAKELGLSPKTPLTYRAGDQPNNAFSLNVLTPGEVAATAGTSGVIYGVSQKREYDEKSRVNTFLHVNHDKNRPRYGVLLCINGTGILYRWLKTILGTYNKNINYATMNNLAQEAPVGSDGLFIYPFGNGAERMLENKDLGCRISNLRFNSHNTSHLIRASCEGIVFSFRYGLDIMRKVGVNPSKIRAGFTNMFLSPLFAKIFATITDATLELYDTDGSQGAARAAGVGSGIYKNIKDAYAGLKKIKTVVPDKTIIKQYQEIYALWRQKLDIMLKSA